MVLPRLVRAKDPPQAPLAPDGLAPDGLTERSDDELMILSQAGLKSAFAVLVERHAKRVVGLCSRFVNSAHLGQELAQDTWVMVWHGRETYRAEGGFVPWLVTVARNHCRNHLRRSQVVSAHRAESPPEESGTSTEQLDRLIVEERRRRVRKALEELTPPMREVLLLRYGEELRYDEMATVVGTGESTLRSRVHHGLKILKKKLEEEC